MPIGDYTSTFAGRPIQNYTPDEGLSDPSGSAIRVAGGWDEGEKGQTIAGVLEALFSSDGADRIEALVVGPWEEMYENDSSELVHHEGRAIQRLKHISLCLIAGAAAGAPGGLHRRCHVRGLRNFVDPKQ